MQSAPDTATDVVSPMTYSAGHRPEEYAEGSFRDKPVRIFLSLSEEEEAYLRQLSPKELKSYHIAKSHLTMSFDLSKSNGFLQWKKEQTQ